MSVERLSWRERVDLEEPPEALLDEYVGEIEWYRDWADKLAQALASRHVLAPTEVADLLVEYRDERNAREWLSA